MTDQPSDEWIKHDGGPCPVRDEAIVFTRFRYGRESKRETRACFWKAGNDWWQHLGEKKNDIIAYRVVKP